MHVHGFVSLSHSPNLTLSPSPTVNLPRPWPRLITRQRNTKKYKSTDWDFKIIGLAFIAKCYFSIDSASKRLRKNPTWTVTCLCIRASGRINAIYAPNRTRRGPTWKSICAITHRIPPPLPRRHCHHYANWTALPPLCKLERCKSCNRLRSRRRSRSKYEINRFIRKCPKLISCHENCSCQLLLFINCANWKKKTFDEVEN